MIRKAEMKDPDAVNEIEKAGVRTSRAGPS